VLFFARHHPPSVMAEPLHDPVPWPTGSRRTTGRGGRHGEADQGRVVACADQEMSRVQHTWLTSLQVSEPLLVLRRATPPVLLLRPAL
jgi:hypothetical protein